MSKPTPSQKSILNQGGLDGVIRRGLRTVGQSSKFNTGKKPKKRRNVMLLKKDQ